MAPRARSRAALTILLVSALVLSAGGCSLFGDPPEREGARGSPPPGASPPVQEAPPAGGAALPGDEAPAQAERGPEPGGTGAGGTAPRPAPSAPGVTVDRGSYDMVTVPPGGEIAVAEGPFLVRFPVAEDTTLAQARDAVTVEGGTLRRLALPSQGTLDVHLAAGPLGSTGRVRVAGLGPDGGDLELRFRVVERPGVSVEVATEAGWIPLHRAGRLPRRDVVRLRLTFSEPPAPREKVEHTLARQAIEAGAAGGGRFLWEGDRVLVWDLPDPPPVLNLAIYGVPGRETGLAFEAAPGGLRVSGPAWLAAVAPAEAWGPARVEPGDYRLPEERLGELPLDVWWAEEEGMVRGRRGPGRARRHPPPRAAMRVRGVVS